MFSILIEQCNDFINRFRYKNLEQPNSEFMCLSDIAGLQFLFNK